MLIETMRASGPGGQHVNKTETAVRATHVATGLSVKVGGSRSQSANKAAALALLNARLQAQTDAGQARDRMGRRARHAAGQEARWSGASSDRSSSKAEAACDGCL